MEEMFHNEWRAGWWLADERQEERDDSATTTMNRIDASCRMTPPGEETNHRSVQLNPAR